MFSYTPNFIPNKIMIVGCGGTGSRLVPLVAQFIKTCAWVLDPEIVLVDGDVVEEKNLFRQNFIAKDVGQNKAEVLANRYARAFNTNIVALPTMLSKSILEVSIPKDLSELANKFKTNSIVVLCVDSPKARLEVLSFLRYFGVGTNTNSSVLLLDSGNENDFGQVSVSTLSYPANYVDKYLAQLPNNIPGDITIPCIPFDQTYFTEMKETSAPSCADLDQTMAINTMMAVSLFGIIQNMYYAKPIKYHRIDISLSYGATPQYMNTDFVTKCMKNKRDTTLPGHIVDIQEPVYDFIVKVYNPFKEQMEKAEKAAKLAKAAKEAEEANKTSKVEDDLEVDSTSDIIRPKKPTKKIPVSPEIALNEDTTVQTVYYYENTA